LDIGFTLDDVYLPDKKVYIGKVDSGFWEDIFIPDNEHYTESVLGMDGAYYFGQVLKERKIPPIPCFFEKIDGNEKRDLQKFLYFKKPKKLSFDNKPYKYIWVVSYGLTNLNYVYDGYYYGGYFELNLVAYDPYFYSFFSSLDEYNYDNPDLYYDSGLLYAEEMPSVLLTNIIKNQSFQLYNAGNANSKTIVTISGTGNNIVLSNLNTGQSFKIVSLNNELIKIDGIKGQITDGTILKSSKHEGNFIELVEGFNNLTLSGDTGFNISSISFSYRHTYL